MEEKNISATESIEIISRMIQSTRNTINEEFWFYILWGWSVLVAAISQYILIRLDFPMNFLPWVILMPLAGIASAILGYRIGRKQRVKTFVDEFLNYVWGAFGIAICIVIFFMGNKGWDFSQPVFILLYGIATFISGGALKFRPLKIGGLLCFPLCIGSIFVAQDVQLLFIAAAVIISYLVPGHLMQLRYRRETIQRS